MILPPVAAGLIAASATPFLGAAGAILWDKAWLGSPFSLNLFKSCFGAFCFIGVSLAIRMPMLNDVNNVFNICMVGASAVLGMVIGDNFWLSAMKSIGVRRIIIGTIWIVINLI